MVRYKMVGRDINSAPLQYRTWVVNDEPDFTGQFYTGLKSGANPLIDIVAFEILDPNAVVDFNLPDPLDWHTTRKVLPKASYKSQLAIIDGYAYLFGGEGDSSIYIANLNNPADWTQTNGHLPGPLGNSQLAVVDGYIFLFGGSAGGGQLGITNVIYSAPVSNPLNWSVAGALPQGLSSSQLGLIDGYLYLFGGFTSKGPTNAIFSAPVSNPTSWINTGATLPQPLYGSTIGIIDGYTYLFGGMSTLDNPSFRIYVAPNSNPLNWSNGLYALPYPLAHSQFCTVGGQGYLFGPTVSGATTTKILYCNLNQPQIWFDSNKTIPGCISQSQIGVIYDRLWLFGGSGSSIIWACEPLIKANLQSVQEVNYGLITRTMFNAITDPTQLFSLLGFPNWKTDYGS